MKILATLTLLFSALISFSQANDIVQLKNELKKYKKEAKAELGGKRYDGSKTTYFTATNKKQYKEVEVVLFLRENYTLIFNGKGAPSKTVIRFYDKPGYDPNRILLKEVASINGKITTQNSKELNEKYHMLTQSDQRLHSVYVEYEFKKSKVDKRGGMVLVLGY